MGKNALKYRVYGLVSRNKKGEYTDDAGTVLGCAIERLKSNDPADNALHFGVKFSTKQMVGIAERLDAIGIYVGELPETWIKGTRHGDNGAVKEAHCLMGYSSSCRKLIEEVVDFDLDTWNSVTSHRFNVFAEDYGLVSLNDNKHVDVKAFKMFLGRTAVALREYAEAIETGNRKRTWAKCVDSAFWRQRKTLGLVADKKSAFAGKGK